MAELPEHTVFLFPTHPFCTALESDQPSGTFDGVVGGVTGPPADASPPPADLTRQTLAGWTRACLAGRLASIRDQVAEDFRLGSGDLQSRSRKQRLAFARQLAMYL